MTPQPKHRVPWTMIVIALLVLAYPLSAGPVEWLIWNTEFDEDPLEAFYSPLMDLAGQSETFGQF